MGEHTKFAVRLGVELCGVLALLWVAVELASIARRGVAPPVGATERSSSGIANRLDAMDLRLSQLESMLDRVAAQAADARAVPAPVGVSTTREPIEGAIIETAPIAEQLAGLRHDLRTLMARSVSEPTRLADAARGRKTDWYQLEAFRQLYQQDENAATQGLLFATAAEVVERFGKPTSVQSRDNGDMEWGYDRGSGEAGDQWQRVWVKLRDGLVVSVSAR